MSTTTTTGCKGSSLLWWYRLPENAYTTTASTLSLREEGVFKYSGTYRIVFKSYFHTKYARISFFPLCCVDRLLLYGEHVSKMAGRCHQRGLLLLGVAHAFTNTRQEALLATGRRWIKSHCSKLRRRIGRRVFQALPGFFCCSWQEMLNCTLDHETIDHEIFLDKIACLGFSDSAILWFKSYLQDRSISVNIGKEYSDLGNLSCGVPQGSILGPLIFLLYVNDMARAVDCDLLLYADDSCLIFRDTDVERIENNLNTNFNSLCNWFVENKLSIHFGEDKTKSILFARKKYKNLKKMNIRRGDIEIKQHSVVTYLGSVLDEILSGESMATKMLGKINGKLKFLHIKQNFLDSSLRRLLLNALIQPHFD